MAIKKPVFEMQDVFIKHLKQIVPANVSLVDDIADLLKISNYLNSETFKSNFMYSKRFKIGHRQISNSYIPNDCL